jgi:hypothetical protein
MDEVKAAYRDMQDPTVDCSGMIPEIIDPDSLEDEELERILDDNERRLASQARRLEEVMRNPDLCRLPMIDRPKLY